jgi:CubicO group peptidase (beta-lactamase class C family)
MVLATTPERAPFARTAPGPGFDRAGFEKGVRQILRRWPCVGLAVGVVRDGQLEFASGHGFADLVAGNRVTEDTVFRVGSITKTFTTVAVMQLWEQGLVDLDGPVSESLRAYRLVPRGGVFRQPTLRQLLTHTSGIPDVRHIEDLLHVSWGPWDARPPIHSVPYGERLPSLMQYYRDGLAVVAEPGTAFAYSNHGFATVGQIVEDVSGIPLARYLRECVFEPLGMADTDIARSDRIAARMATGYAFGRQGPAPVPDRDWIGGGFGGAYSSLRDLARYAGALLGGGANEHGSVLKGSTLAMMFERHYQTDPALPAMGLGFFLTDAGGQRVAGHDGILPGFNSHLSVAPEAGIGLIALTNGSAGAMRWIPGEMDGLLRQLLGIGEAVTRDDIPQRPESWNEIIGCYGLPPRIGDLRGRLALGPGLEVYIGGGRPILRLRWPLPGISRGVALVPDDPMDPCAFRVDLTVLGMGMVRLRFRRDAMGKRVIHTDLGAQPVSFEEVPGAGRLRWWMAGAAGGLAAGAVVATRRGRNARSQG